MCACECMVLHGAYVTTLLLYTADFKINYSKYQCVGHVSFLISHNVILVSRQLDVRAQESNVIRNVKPPRCGEVSSKPHTLSWGRTQAIGTLAHGSYL